MLLGVALIIYSCSCLEVQAFDWGGSFRDFVRDFFNRGNDNDNNQQDDSGNQDNSGNQDDSTLTEEEKGYKKVIDALKCASTGKAKDLMELYNLGLDLDTDGVFTLSMKPDKDKFRDYPELRYANPSFTVSRILIASPTTRVIGYEEYLADNSLLNILDDIYTQDRLNSEFGIWSQVLSENSTIQFRNVRSDVVVYYIVLESTEYDSILSSECGIDDAKSYFAIPVYAYGSPEEITTLHITYDENATPTKNLIDCYSSHPAGSFEANYCADLYAACGTYEVEKCNNKNFIKFTSSGKTDESIPTYADYIKKNPKKSISTFKCSPFVTAAADGSYYTEKQYIVGTITQRVKLKDDKGAALQYVYNYGGQYTEAYGETLVGKAPYKSDNPKNGQYVQPTTQDIYCNVNCTEVVTVEYGPPVASAAGLCFEYKVKTTSRINCTSKLETTPKDDPQYCKPTASCITPKPPSPPVRTYYYYDPEGPNEDFDMCVTACDGGKYTDECTHYCYNEVYGTSSSVLKNKVVDFSEVIEKLRNQNPMAKNCDNSKNFFYSIGSTIKWRQVDCVATPYLSEDGKYHGTYTYVKNYANGGGIPCAMSCVLECKWTKCGNGGKDVYLNAGEAERDAAKNQIVYDKAKTACDSFIKCNTTTAEFSIDVTYNYPESKKTGANIHFPYSDNDQTTKDTITYTKDSITCSKTKANSTLNFGDGCYLCNKKEPGEVSYQTEWGLPPTWINKKNGVISYSDEYQGNDSWIKKNKFCLPLDATSTNVEWWNAYYEARATEKGIEFSYEDQDYMNGIDATKCTATSCESVKSSTTVKDYNINAHAKNFGMFSWNIDISCFYATNTDTARFADNKSCKSDNCSTGYTIRSVDLQQMFPSSTDDNSERSPGFNWSTYASVTKEKLDTPGVVQEKNEKYTSYPSLYKEWVEAENYNVYSDDYLDYYVKLTKESISEIKKADVTNYANFEGQAEVLKSSPVVNYLSPLLRGQARETFKISDVSYPSLSVLRCNNIGKHLGGKEGYMADCLDYEELETKESGTNE